MTGSWKKVEYLRKCIRSHFSIWLGTDFCDIGDLPYGATVNVSNADGADAWVEIEPGKWVCV